MCANCSDSSKPYSDGPNDAGPIATTEEWSKEWDDLMRPALDWENDGVKWAGP